MTSTRRSIVLTLVFALVMPIALLAGKDDDASEKRKPKNSKEDVEQIGERHVRAKHRDVPGQRSERHQALPS